MCACRMTDQHDPPGVEAEATGVGAQESRCFGDVGGFILDRGLRHQPIIDRSNGVAEGVPVRELGRAVHHRHVATFPSSAVDEHHER